MHSHAGSQQARPLRAAPASIPSRAPPCPAPPGYTLKSRWVGRYTARTGRRYHEVFTAAVIPPLYGIKSRFLFGPDLDSVTMSRRHPHPAPPRPAVIRICLVLGWRWENGAICHPPGMSPVHLCVAYRRFTLTEFHSAKISLRIYSRPSARWSTTTPQGMALLVTWHSVAWRTGGCSISLCFQRLSEAFSSFRRLSDWRSTLLFQTDGRSHRAQIVQAGGGVGRNIADALGRLGARPLLVSTVGDDLAGQFILKDSLAHIVRTARLITACTASHQSRQTVSTNSKFGPFSHLRSKWDFLWHNLCCSPRTPFFGY